MDQRTGDLYNSRDEALGAGVPLDDIVEMRGKPEHVKAIAAAVAASRVAERRQRNKAARASRKRNRR